MGNFKIFIVEDDPWYGELLKYHLSLNADFEVVLFTSPILFLDQLYRKPDLITIDYNMPEMNGDKLFDHIKSFNNTIPVIVISGQNDIGIALNIIKQGAVEYIIKDDHTKDVLWNSVNRILENAVLKQTVEDLKVQLETKFDFEKSIIGSSASLKKSFQLIEKAIKSNINVSITGETGTGKEVVAKAIHYNSARSKRPFIAVNMAAIPRELVESELFGYEKGAFTGANTQKKGKFEEANGGTIFLDEIAEADLNFQSKLLRVLQEREISRVGGNDTIKLDVRIITATHKNIAEEVRAGRFREDLYYRLMGLPIELPTLKQRGNDILILAKYFADMYALENKCPIFTFSQEAKDKLMKHHYPGNVRELKAIVDLACVMSDSNVISEPDITLPTNPIPVEQLFSAQ